MTHDDFDAFSPRPRSRPQQPPAEDPTVAFSRPDYDSPVRYDTRQDPRAYAGEHSDPHQPQDPRPPRRRPQHWAWVIGAVVLALVGVTGVMLVLGGIGDSGKPDAAGTVSIGARSPTGPAASFPGGVGAADPSAPIPPPSAGPGRGSAPGTTGTPGTTGAAPGAGSTPGARPTGGGANGGGPVVQHPKPTGSQRAIPNVVGLGVNDAFRTLRQAGFRTSALFIGVNDRAQVGKVLRQSPEPGAPLEGGLGVTVLVGAGSR